MTIETNVNGKEMTMKIGGRLDTTTAPELEKAVSDSIYDVEKLIFDFKDLSYISSAGLRVLLSTQKKMNQQGEMILTGVNEDIMEIFEVTGFDSILTIR